jgi:hypothetical protein
MFSYVGIDAGYFRDVVHCADAGSSNECAKEMVPKPSFCCRRFVNHHPSCNGSIGPVTR